MRFLWIWAVLVLAGCVTQPTVGIDKEIAAEGAKAVLGEIKWSEYYATVYKKYAVIPDEPKKEYLLTATLVLRDAAIAMEKGRMTKQEFQGFQMGIGNATDDVLKRPEDRYTGDRLNIFGQYLIAQKMRIEHWEKGEGMSLVTDPELCYVASGEGDVTPDKQVAILEIKRRGVDCEKHRSAVGVIGLTHARKKFLESIEKDKASH
ncbi:MAG: hypothetical protein RPU34_17085 [Candidatus Sedimenticola sp. (ex Thyasira tokunagai)]